MSKSKPKRTKKKTGEQSKRTERKRQGPLTLAPLEFKEALEGLLATPPPLKDAPKEDKSKTDEME